MKNTILIRENGPSGFFLLSIFSCLFVLTSSCKQQKKAPDEVDTTDSIVVDTTGKTPDVVYTLSSELYTADPSAHVFEGKLYVYPSHDFESGIPEDDLGSHFNMEDYHVFSMDSVGGEVTDHGLALHIDDVPWAGRQMWAPDAAEKGGEYFLYFPVKDKKDIFRIGVAKSTSPAGPFKALDLPIGGSYSMDPAVFEDADGKYYMYFGGIWGGQLQQWKDGEYLGEDLYPADDEPAIAPKIALMSDDMVSFAEAPKDILILDKNGDPIKAGDNDRRFFEAAWVHRYNGTYYLSYSTGDTHNIAYAIADNPYGPFTYQGVILDPVLGWTNHHSIVEYQGKWWLFFHDSSMSGGKTHLRSVKMTELTHNPDGTIQRLNAFEGN
ncbi:glycoside hydrolase family 43 protein [Flagellimonas amoyensis]|uniref:glycoside hydrolase family 43 protein n=1 Tax=Flagellimonas amoyensis TaxID=2169401 RepID=UPI000D38AD1F|nr:glycoside hydrolase family 43 protein [Allomuricauda amoyensis]